MFACKRKDIEEVVKFLQWTSETFIILKSSLTFYRKNWSNISCAWNVIWVCQKQAKTLNLN